jgi:predicted acylesterase/phospholipase RssA
MSDALTTEQVLAAEFQEIWPGLPKPDNQADYCKAVHQLDQAALCLSGGGIRSASFSLGVIQALAKKGLLSHFHYLSTVSGGGYIGAWLQRWVHERGGDAKSVCDEIAGDAGKPAPPLPQIEALRERSNFLTPRASLVSTDFWATAVITVRNVLLNWLIFAPALIAVVIVPVLYLSLIKSGMSCLLLRPDTKLGLSFTDLGHNVTNCPFDLVFVLTYTVLVVGSAYLSTYRTRLALPSNSAAGESLSHKAIVRTILIPSLIFAFVIPLLVNLNVEHSKLRWWLFAAIWAPCFMALVASGITLSGRRAVTSASILWIAICALTSALPVLMAWLIHKHQAGWTLLILATIGPLIAMWSLTLQAMFYVGLNKQDFQGDVDREWLARMSALRVVPVQAWVLLAGTCLILPWAYEGLKAGVWRDYVNSTTAAITAISGLIAVFGGKSAIVSVEPIATSKGRGLRLSLRFMIGLATTIFVLALLALLAASEQWAAERLATSLSKRVMTSAWIPDLVKKGLGHRAQAAVAIHIAFLLTLFCFVRYFGRRINVNRFSLHGVYRNRLTRAFLGAARAGTPDNTRDRFTGFDPTDNVRLHQLRGTSDKGRILFPVINATMNLTRNDNLAWQERMASSFVMTPIACGSDSLRLKITVQGTTREADRPGAYISSKVYGGSEPDLGGTDHGISLGTAMTISGAAASPSMGYNSTPTTAFLMTLFNVRLGAWLANPALNSPKDYERAGPNDALRPLYSEMFSQTHADGRDVYLSDGGHFENLGLYEMVRRRCRFILVVDAGADERCLFEDLGNVVRKVAIDLNTDISFAKMDIASRADAKDLVSFAIGRIHYPEAKEKDEVQVEGREQKAADPKVAVENTQARPEEDAGWLIYLKPSYFKNSVPLDVQAYAEANSMFPHEPTFDQWFSESQFESYRRLGFYLASTLGKASSYPDLPSFFADVSGDPIKPRGASAGAT